MSQSERAKGQAEPYASKTSAGFVFGAVIVCEEGELVIGRHSVVGANSVITRSIFPYSVVAGDPAKIVKQYDFAKNKWVLGCIRPTVGLLYSRGSRLADEHEGAVFASLKVKALQERLEKSGTDARHEGRLGLPGAAGIYISEIS
jgi:hypothetical protein